MKSKDETQNIINVMFLEFQRISLESPVIWYTRAKPAILSFYIISRSFIFLSLFLLNANLTLTSSFTSHSYHIIYDNIGSLGTRLSHIHVAILINISALHLKFKSSLTICNHSLFNLT